MTTTTTTTAILDHLASAHSAAMSDHADALTAWADAVGHAVENTDADTLTLPLADADAVRRAQRAIPGGAASRAANVLSVAVAMQQFDAIDVWQKVADASASLASETAVGRASTAQTDDQKSASAYAALLLAVRTAENNLDDDTVATVNDWIDGGADPSDTTLHALTGRGTEFGERIVARAEKVLAASSVGRNYTRTVQRGPWIAEHLAAVCEASPGVEFTPRQIASTWSEFVPTDDNGVAITTKAGTYCSEGAVRNYGVSVELPESVDLTDSGTFVAN